MINAQLHGSPFRSGYGTTSELYSWSRVPINLGLYLNWFAQVHTPFALCGLAAILVPVRRLWPNVRDRSGPIVIATFVVGVWLIYCAWLVFDAWWFARFLLSSWPFIMLGVGSVAAAAYRSSARYLRPVVVAAVIALAIFQLEKAITRDTFDTRDNRRRFVAVARLVRRMTDRNSVIVSFDYSGSIRDYGGRMTMNYAAIPSGQSLDAIVEWLTAHGVRTYLAVEDGELQEFVQRFAGNACLRALDGPPLAIYERPGRTLLFDSRSRVRLARCRLTKWMWTSGRGPPAPCSHPRSSSGTCPEISQLLRRVPGIVRLCGKTPPDEAPKSACHSDSSGVSGVSGAGGVSGVSGPPFSSPSCSARRATDTT